MEALRRFSHVGLAASGLLLFGTAGGLAHGPVTLTDGQLDHVTAGAGFVFAIADAGATGAFTLLEAGTTSFGIQEPSPYPNNPGLAPSGGASDGTAIAVGTNGAVPNAPGVPSSTASVQTGGSATGNMVINHTFNQTITGVGGVSAQVGWTFVWGAWVGL